MKITYHWKKQKIHMQFTSTISRNINTLAETVFSETKTQ